MGSLKVLNLYYEVLQLRISNFKSTGKLIGYRKKIKHAKIGNAMLDNKPLNEPSNYKMNFHNELISQKRRRVKLMGLNQHLRR